jgi:hypothetical protein
VSLYLCGKNIFYFRSFKKFSFQSSVVDGHDAQQDQGQEGLGCPIPESQAGRLVDGDKTRVGPKSPFAHQPEAAQTNREKSEVQGKIHREKLSLGLDIRRNDKHNAQEANEEADDAKESHDERPFGFHGHILPEIRRVAIWAKGGVCADSHN